MTYTNSIEIGDDQFDSRQVIEKIEELEGEIEAQQETIDDPDSSDEDRATALDEIEDAREELAPWKELADEAEGYCSDWLHGESLILAEYFETYAEELADSIGAIDSNARWPLSHIDWKAAADELKQDYTEVEAGGHSYFVR